MICEKAEDVPTAPAAVWIAVSGNSLQSGITEDHAGGWTFERRLVLEKIR